MRTALFFILLAALTALPAPAETTAAGPYQVEVTTQPDPPVVGDNEVMVSVTVDGDPAREAEVTITYDMVGMSMDMTPPTLSPMGPGRFGGPLLLSMPGLWKLQVEVTGPQGSGSGEVVVKTGEGQAQGHASHGEGGDYQVSLDVDPAIGDIPARIEVKTPEGKPVSGATVYVGADMPGMAMGLRPVKAEQVEDGVYRAVVPLSMEGLWKLKVEVDGESHEFSTVVERSSGPAQWIPWVAAGLGLVALGVALVRKWPLWQVGILVLLGLAAWGLTRYADTRRPADKSMGMKMDMAAADMGMNIADMQAPVPVAIEEVERGTVAMTVTYTGTVDPFLEETVYPRVEGWLLELPLYPGDRVQAGQVVGRLDDRQLSQVQARAEAAARSAESRSEEARARMEATAAGTEVAQAELLAAQKRAERARADIHKTQVDLDYWQGVYNREKELFEAEAVSREELEEKESRYATAKVMHHHAEVDLERALAEVEAKKAALEQAQRQVSAARAGVASSQAQEREAELAAAERGTVTDYTVLRSRIDGVVTERITDPGVLVRPGMGLLKVAQIDRVRLQFTVAEEDVVYIDQGTPITVTAPVLRHPLEAEVTSMFHSLNERSRTGLVEAVVDNPYGRLLPGAYVVGEFALRRERNVPWVPRSALVTYYEDPAVWVAEERAGELVAARRPVRVGAESDERIEILRGLSAGDRVIVAGHQNLVEGSPVVAASYGEGIYRNLLLPEKPGGHQP